MTKKKIVTFFKSLKFRLIILFLLFGILPGILLRAGMLQAYEKKAVSNRSIDILSQAKILANRVVADDYLHNSTSEVINAQLDQLSTIYDGRVILIDDTFRIVKDTYGLDQDKTIISEEVMQSFYGKEMSNYDSENRYIEMTIPLTDAGTKDVVGVMLVSVSTDSILSNLDYLKTSILTIQVISALVILAVAVFLAGRLTRPFFKISKSIEEIQTGYGSSDLKVDDFSETQEISTKFNELTARMKVLDDSRQEFVSNVSHELKTPLTSISGYSELIESGMAADEDIVRFAAEIHKNSNRLLTLINDIIRLSELDQVEEHNCFEELDIYDIAQNCVEMLRLSARKHDVTMELHGVHRIICANRQMMDELVYNLCDNAIRYNRKGGRVTVTAVAFDKTAETGATIIEVKDTGIGISKEHQERIFERFYRVDKSRSKSTGGTGLGLAIVKHIVAAHKNASLSLTSEPGKGTCIRVAFKMKTNLE
mgnify:CR=1 FL=1